MHTNKSLSRCQTHFPFDMRTSFVSVNVKLLCCCSTWHHTQSVLFYITCASKSIQKLVNFKLNLIRLRYKHTIMSCTNRINSLLQLTGVKSFLRNHGVAAIICTHQRNNTTSSGPIAVLERKLQAGALKADKHQVKVMVALQQLYETIQMYEPPAPAAKNRLFANWFSRKSAKSTIDDSIPKGLYIHGSVGGGKTTLMDLFFDCCKSVSWHDSPTSHFNCNLLVVVALFFFVGTQIDKKKRIHFNSFMTDVHARIHEVKQEESKNLKYVGSDKPNPFDPTRPVADMIARDCWLICFDEFQVNNLFAFLVLNRRINFDELAGGWHCGCDDFKAIVHTSVRKWNNNGGNEQSSARRSIQKRIAAK